MLTRRLRALSVVGVGGCHVGLGLSCSVCLLYVICCCDVNSCVNAPPSGLPNPDPYCITSSVCLLIAQPHCPNHFVLHDSKRDRLPTLPCVTNRPATGLGHATSRLFMLWDCSKCKECTPYRMASKPLHGIQLVHKRSTKSFDPGLVSPSLPLVQ